MQRLDPATVPRWGKMTVQQMIEHFSGDAVQNANGNLKFTEIVTPPAQLDRVREFLMSDKPFRENTQNPLLPEQPLPLRHQTVQAAIGELQQELIAFFEVYQETPQLNVRNPIFGDLNFEQNVQLLYKQALHHLKQFGIEPL